MLNPGDCHPEIKAEQGNRIEFEVEEEYLVFYGSGEEERGGLEVEQKEYQGRLGGSWW